MIIKVIGNEPDGRKKGLRMKITEVNVDDDGKITELFIEYSTGKARGGWVAVIEPGFRITIKCRFSRPKNWWMEE